MNNSFGEGYGTFTPVLYWKIPWSDKSLVATVHGSQELWAMH